MNSFPRILLIDDDAHMRMLLEHLLSRDYLVSSCRDGMEGMSLLASGILPDLILADLDTPRLNGVELLGQLRRSGLFRHIPVVIICPKQSDCDALLRAGADDVLRKPFNPEVLRELVERILGRRTRASAS